MTEKEYYELIGKELRGLREKERYKKIQLEEKTGIKGNYLSNVENHGKKISLYNLAQVLDAMGYSITFTEKKTAYTRHDYR